MSIPAPPSIIRSESETVADICSVSRAIARQAINAAGGDINAACANLLLNTLRPHEDSPFETLLKRGDSAESVGGEMVSELVIIDYSLICIFLS